MKIATKLVTIIVIGIIAVLAVDSYISIRRDTEIHEANMKRDAHLVGRSLRDLIADVWQNSGRARAMELIEHADKEHYLLNIRWVDLNARPGDLHSPYINRANLGTVMQGQDVSFRIFSKDGNEYFYTYVPVKTDNNEMGALELSQDLSGLKDHIRHNVYRIFVLTFIFLFLSVMAILLLGFFMIGQPLNLLVEKIRRIGEGDLSEPLRMPGKNEFSELAKALNTMCEQLNTAQEKARRETAARIEAMEQLRHADRLKTIGGLASGIAHELGTPLNVVSGRAGLITTGDLSKEEIKESADIIKTQSERMTEIIRRLLNFARRDLPKKIEVDLRQIVLQTINLMSSVARKQRVNLYFSGEDIPAMAKVDAGQIQQVLTNLISNAMQSMTAEGKVEIGIRREHIQRKKNSKDSLKNYFRVYILDEGSGIQEKDLKNIFEPFFTTKDSGHGTGLGLSIAYGIIQEHDGWIDVESIPGKGSCFSVYLPREDE